MPELDAAPVLARYREHIQFRGWTVYNQQAGRIFDQLHVLVENHGLAVAHEFLDHVITNCHAPYLADVMYAFEARWWGYDRKRAQPEPKTPTDDAQARAARTRAQNDRLRERALAGARSA